MATRSFSISLLSLQMKDSNNMDNSRKNVTVNVCTVQKDKDGKSTIEASYDGVMYYKSGVFYVFYTEYSEDGEETAKCRLKLDHDEVEIKREGAYGSRLSFRQGSSFKSMYNTPYGSMPVEIKTKKCINAVDNQGGKIVLDYRMSIAGNEFDNNVAIILQIIEDERK